MDVEVDGMKNVNLIDAEVDKAYSGLLVEYHKELGERVAHALAVWANDYNLRDVLNEIRYARRVIDERVLVDSQRSRYGKD